MDPMRVIWTVFGIDAAEIALAALFETSGCLARAASR